MRRLIGIAAALAASAASGQSNVGQLLDGGAVKLSAVDFRQEIVGKFLLGPGRGGSSVSNPTEQEVVYLASGSLSGSGRVSNVGGTTGYSYIIQGTWTTDDRDRVCQSIRSGDVVLAPRCQYWFKQSDTYFFSDSDSDRSAAVTVRRLKPN